MKPGAFATGVAARHVAQAGTPRRAALVLPRPSRPMVSRRAMGARHLHQRWMLRLSLHLKRIQQVFRIAPIAATTVHTHSALPGRIQPGGSQEPGQVNRIERIGATPRRLPAAPLPQPLVIRRSPPAQPIERPAAPPAVAAPGRETGPALSRGLPAQLPPVELDRVTDHVIRNLDRRLSSWRERRGKG